MILKLGRLQHNRIPRMSRGPPRRQMKLVDVIAIELNLGNKRMVGHPTRAKRRSMVCTEVEHRVGYSGEKRRGPHTIRHRQGW